LFALIQHCCKAFLQQIKQFFVGSGTRPGQHYNVNSRSIVCRELAEGFPDLTLDSIPVYSKGYIFLANYHAKAIKALLIGLCKEQQAGSAMSCFVLVEYPIEFYGLLKTMARRELEAGLLNRHWSAIYRPAVTRPRLSRQYFAAFCSAALEHKPARLGCHPGSETVSSLALDDARLKGSFHGRLPDNG
jgi:hypothetical protein